jgi:riboflavin kinase / FMN adenylyltransferase
MDLVNSPAQIPNDGRRNLVAVGKWDGVHLAHQAIVDALVARARTVGGRSVVFGFHPLPMTVLSPETAPPVLQTLEERSEVLAALGVDLYLAMPFTLSFAATPPEEFVRTVLVGQLAALEVLVGFNFTFGRGGKATATDLSRLCAGHGIPVTVVEPVREIGESVSSSLIRFYVAAGEMQRTAGLLGRPFSMAGEVVAGDRRGRTIGYPTANLSLAESRQLPAPGVYVVRAAVLEGALRCESLPCAVEPRSGPVFGGMCNLGWRPTFAGKDLRCEVHLFDWAGDLYGRQLRVEFLHRLRGEEAFAGIDLLVQQLKRDEEAARRYLAAPGQ